MQMSQTDGAKSARKWIRYYQNDPLMKRLGGESCLFSGNQPPRTVSNGKNYMPMKVIFDSSVAIISLTLKTEEVFGAHILSLVLVDYCYGYELFVGFWYGRRNREDKGNWQE